MLALGLFTLPSLSSAQQKEGPAPGLSQSQVPAAQPVQAPAPALDAPKRPPRRPPPPGAKNAAAS